MVGSSGRRSHHRTGPGEISRTEKIGREIRQEGPMTKLLLTFYGDDFTGSTDAMEQLTLADVRTVLFVEPPTPAQLKRFPNLRAIGVAGMTRAMAPEAMAKTLRPAFQKLKKLGARHIHYKVCSTFDSSPQIGSIGRALEIGSEIFRSPFVPI